MVEKDQFPPPNLIAFPRSGSRQSFDGGHGGGDDGGMDARLTALETKWETVIPTLATKNDVSELRTEIAKGFADQTKWIIGTAAAGIAVFITLMTFVLNNATPKAGTPQASPPIIINVPSATPPAAPASRP